LGEKIRQSNHLDPHNISCAFLLVPIFFPKTKYWFAHPSTHRMYVLALVYLILARKEEPLYFNGSRTNEQTKLTNSFVRNLREYYCYYWVFA